MRLRSRKKIKDNLILIVFYIGHGTKKVTHYSKLKIIELIIFSYILRYKYWCISMGPFPNESKTEYSKFYTNR